jgi:hypothetical protein
MKRNVLNSSRLIELKKHRHKATRNKILFFLCGILIIFVLLVFLSKLKNLNISNIEVSGNQVVDTNSIKTTIEKQMAGKYLWLFPKTNLFLYPENSIKKELENEFPRLENINLSIKNNKTLEVSLSERKALYTWCGVVPDVGILQGRSPTSGTPSCYFVDENGYIFDQAPYFSGEVYFKFYGTPDVGILQVRSPTSGTLEHPTSATNPSGSYFSQQYFKQLISFRDILVGFGLKPVAMYVGSDGNVEVALSGGTSFSTDPQIILKLNADYQNVAENLEAALTTEPLQSEFKNKYATLEYIDLRFGNKVYYKFKVI